MLDEMERIELQGDFVAGTAEADITRQYVHLGFGSEATDTVITIARDHASTMRAMRDDIHAPAVRVGVVVRVAVG